MKKQIALLRSQETPRKNSVGHADSVEKILAQLALLSPDVVTYQARSLRTGFPLQERVFDAPVDVVILAPALFRTFRCVAGCTACCQKFTLDYTPHEYQTLVTHKTGFERRVVSVNDKKKHVFTNDQNDNPICDFLSVQRPDAVALGCAHFPYPPLSCISAPQLQFIQMRHRTTYVLSKPFGRAWAMTPTPQCEFEEPADQKEFRDQMEMRIEILMRFQEWARYFGIRTCLRQILREMRKVRAHGHIPQQPKTVWERV